MIDEYYLATQLTSVGPDLSRGTMVNRLAVAGILQQSGNSRSHHRLLLVHHHDRGGVLRRLPLVHPNVDPDRLDALLLEDLIGLVVRHPYVDPDLGLDGALELLPAQGAARLRCQEVAIILLQLPLEV